MTPTVGVRHESAGLREYVDVTYQPTPVPLQVGRSNYVDNDRVGLVLGGDYTFTAYKSGRTISAPATATGRRRRCGRTDGMRMLQS